MSHIFISYARRNKLIVDQFVEGLRKQDFVVWQDVSNLSAGDKWQQALLDAIEQSSVVLVFWSQFARLSPSVNMEINHAIKHDKTIIPVWLDKNEPLRDGLQDNQAVITSGFSNSILQKIVQDLMTSAPRIQRKVSEFDPSLPMKAQSIDEITREVIGDEEYVLVPLVKSAYSSAVVIAKASTIVRQASRIQLIIQNTGPANYSTVQAAFKAVLETDKTYPEEAKPLVGLYVTGVQKPTDITEYWIDNTNVAHYSDMVDTTRKAITAITKGAADTQVFQLFQKTLVDIAFLLGVSLDRWLPFQLYKWDGANYTQIMNIPPRHPN